MIYAKAYVPVTITFKGYNPNVKFNWQARTSNGEYYHSNYPGEDPDNVHNLSLCFYMPGTYTVDTSMGDLICGWTGRTYTINVEANPDLKYDVQRDIYYLP